MPSRWSSLCSMAASRRNVSRLPSPASTSRRVCEVSSSVQLPELPDARMLTRRLMYSPPGHLARRLVSSLPPGAKKLLRPHHRKSAPCASIMEWRFVSNGFVEFRARGALPPRIPASRRSNLSRKKRRASAGTRSADPRPSRQSCPPGRTPVRSAAPVLRSPLRSRRATPPR